MRAVILTIGDELLIGQTIDTNSAWMGAELSKAGFDVFRRISIHDSPGDIIGMLAEVSKSGADVVLITGGLGPTSDDLTKQTLCDFFGTRLVMNDSVLGMIEAMMARRNFAMNENNRRQAEVPESCRVLANAVGTAPGMWFEKDKVIYVSMPGVPHEMKYIMNEHVLPELKKRFTSQVIIHKNIMTYGTFEARLAEILTDFEKGLPSSVRLAYLPSAGVIKLRLTATGNDKALLQNQVNEQVDNLYRIIPEFIYAEDEEPIEKVTGLHLKKAGKTVCTAESCTGGSIARLLTSIPGSSDYFTGSVVSYANSAKIKILDVPGNLIDEHGAVSEQVVRKMAENARTLFHSDYSVATSGIAGPDGGSDAKPVGTLWMAVASETAVISEKKVFGTDRTVNIERFTLAALDLLRRQLMKPQ